jgi:preprotein translocase subunit SecA
VLGMNPDPVQYMGALALQKGLVAEMATGEGKTLTVGLAGILAGWTGRPCHILTVNDYLAQRDAQTMSSLYVAAGVQVHSITAEVDPAERVVRYGADVVYLTAKELLADYLRDQLAIQSGRGPRQQAFRCWLNETADLTGAPQGGQLQWRGLHTAIVDEIDSILIDEAVTPLILAAPRDSRGLAQAVRLISDFANTLQAEMDYRVSLRARTITLEDRARVALAQVSGELPVLWRPAPRREELLRQALEVRHFYHAGEHYLVQSGEVVLLDTFTGRLTPGRSLTAGMHQAIEAFEGLEITEPNESLTQMSFQAFFRRFRRLCGCSGTVWEAASELWGVYGVQVVRIPTHRPRIVVERALSQHPDQRSKWAAVVADVQAELARGRPVLVGVRSVTSSEQLAQLLQSAGLQPQVLNALTHDQEAEIIAQAGQPGRLTIATNMAGRGTDIRLGPGVADRGGLHVVIAEVNDSARVDRQLAGRCGRQGDPGSVSLHLSEEDSLMRQHVATAWQHAKPLLGHPRAIRWVLHQAQRQAESEAYARRLSVLRNDDWMSSALPFDGHSQGGFI